MDELPDRAFILAAGKGSRLMPYTADRPKPMVCVGGRPLVDHILDHLHAAGVRKVGINLHTMGDILHTHLAHRRDMEILFFPEDVLLDTGGGIRNALCMMEDKPFYAVNGDAFWENGAAGNAFLRLAWGFDPARMDMLLLLEDTSKMILTQGVGDYDLTLCGQAVRNHARQGRYMFTSLRLLTPRLFEDTPSGAFSFLTLMDRAQTQGRLSGLVHDGSWHHISTPKDLEAVECYLSEQGFDCVDVPCAEFAHDLKNNPRGGGS